MKPAANMTERAQRVLKMTGEMPSPCSSVCSVSAHDGLCQGCFRRIDEIANWPTLGNEDKRQIWSHIANRARSAAT